MRRTALLISLAVSAVVLLAAGCSSSGGGGSAQHTSTGTRAATTSPSVTTSSTGGSTSSTSAPSPASGPKVVHQKLTNFRVVDVTFVGSQAWALGSADCLSGQGVCDAIEYSADNARTWRSAPAPKANIQGTARPHCPSPCVAHLRFASPTVGYAYSSASESTSGHGALFMTTDGGTSWQRRPGNADAIESLDGNVIRVTDQGGCPPDCRYAVQTAAVGSTKWHTVALPGAQPLGAGVALARTGSRAFLESYGNPAGGASSETAVLWTSADDGAHWTNRGEPCPQSGGTEVDSSLLTTAPDGAAVILCRQRRAGGTSFVITSTDGGSSFHAAARKALGSAAVTALGAGSARVVLISSDETYRSTDGGSHFRRLSANGGSSPGQLAYLGFASATLVHGISLDHRRVWTSPDGGVTWTSHRFS